MGSSATKTSSVQGSRRPRRPRRRTGAQERPPPAPVRERITCRNGWGTSCGSGGRSAGTRPAAAGRAAVGGYQPCAGVRAVAATRRRPARAAAAGSALPAVARCGGCDPAAAAATRAAVGPGRSSGAARAARRRARVRSRPSSSIDSYSGGDTVRPVTATRTGPNACRGLRPSPSTSAALSASSIVGGVHSSRADSAPAAASSTRRRPRRELLLGGRRVDATTSSANRNRACPTASDSTVIRSWTSGATPRAPRRCSRGRRVGRPGRRRARYGTAARRSRSSAQHPQVRRR